MSEEGKESRISFPHEVRAIFFFFFPQIYMAGLGCVLVTISTGFKFHEFFYYLLIKFISVVGFILLNPTVIFIHVCNTCKHCSKGRDRHC